MMRNRLSKLPRGIRRLFRLPQTREQIVRDADDEVSFHLAMRAEELRASGMSDEEANAEALRRFGDRDDFRDYSDRRGVKIAGRAELRDLRRDVRLAMRNIRGAPTFFAAVIITLAIGIGANTALFSVVRTVVFDPLPYPRSDELVVVSKSPWNRAEFPIAFREMRHVFQQVAAYSPEPVAIAGDDQSYQIAAARITPNFLQMLGTSVARGRGFADTDAEPGAAPTAILGYSLWMSRYGGRADILGQTIRVNDKLHRVIGIASQDFRLFGPRADDPQVWLPLNLRPLDDRGRPLWVIPVMRLRAGASVAHAQTAVDQMLPAFVDAHPELGRRDRWQFTLATLKAEIVRDVRPALLVLQLTAAALLLIACVNVANLLLVRASARQRDMAIRSALGASRGQLVRQLVAESVTLSVLGGICGVLLMRATLGLLVRLAPSGVPRLADVGVDVPVLLVAIAIAVGTGLIFGLIPAAVALRGSLHEYLKEGGRAPSRSTRERRISHALVMAEVALTLVLLIGACLLAQSFFRLSNQPLGFRTQDVVTMPIQIPPTRYGRVQQLDAFYRSALERIGAIPGVQSVALANNQPINRGNARRGYQIDGVVATAASEKTAQYAVVSPSYFNTLGIPLERGRYFNTADRRDAPRVAIIDRAMAHDAFPNTDPIGKRFRVEDAHDAWITVVGVVENSRGAGLAKDEAPGFYIPYLQRPETISEMAVGRIAVFLIRSVMPPNVLSGAVREAIAAVSPQQPMTTIAPLADVIAEGAAPQRFRAILLGTFAGIALVLVLVGIYGVIESAVAERTREFGIRMALGATPSMILRDVLMWGLRLAGVGALLGLAGALALTRLLGDMLFGVTPTDPWTFALALVSIGAVTLVACIVPARRATSVDPSQALQIDRLVSS